jgi:DNA repair protein RadA/Sms
MPKVKTIFRCVECGTAAAQWAGRCPGCNEWNSLVEERDEPARAAAGVARDSASPMPLDDVDSREFEPRPTGVAELDRVLGGGLVPGSVTLLGGEPGIGKSTLLLQVLASVAGQGMRVLLVSAEESPQQVKLRAERLGPVSPNLWVVGETSLAGAVAAIESAKPDLVVVDSIQTIHDDALTSAPGSVAQVRDCAHALVGQAKERGCAVVLVGHVTKEGSLAGPRVLEHVVDTVLSFEGDRHDGLRLLRAVKHRFGSTGELGLFEMGEQGLVEVPDASGRLLADRRPGSTGSVVVPALEGRRPILVEVQALVTDTNLAIPRRDAQGLGSGRLSLVLAVLESHAALGLGKHDVHASAVGGVRVVEPAADLALALAVASSRRKRPVPPDLVACGELGLGGEVRSVASLDRRLAEAARLGFRRALVPRSVREVPPGIEGVRVSTVAEALAALA